MCRLTLAASQGVGANALLSGAEKPAGIISRPKVCSNQGKQHVVLFQVMTLLLTAQALPSGPRRDGKDNLMETYIKEQVKDEVAEDPDLEKYIQEHIERRLGKRKALDVEPEPTAVRSEEDDLYIIPENLKACSCGKCASCLYFWKLNGGMPAAGACGQGGGGVHMADWCGRGAALPRPEAEEYRGDRGREEKAAGRKRGGGCPLVQWLP